jgi:hypothetical protein
VEAVGLHRQAAGWRPEAVVSTAGPVGGGGRVGGWSAFWTEMVPRGWDIFFNFYGGFIAPRKLTKHPLAVTWPTEVNKTSVGSFWLTEVC